MVLVNWSAGVKGTLQEWGKNPMDSLIALTVSFDKMRRWFFDKNGWL